MMNPSLALLVIVLAATIARIQSNDETIVYQLLKNQRFRRPSGRSLHGHVVSFSEDESDNEDYYYSSGGNGKGRSPDMPETPHSAPSGPSYYRPSSGKGKGDKSSKSIKKNSKSSKSDSSSSRSQKNGGGKPTPKPVPAPTGKLTPKPVSAPTPASPSYSSSRSGPSNDMPARPPAEIPPSSGIMPTFAPSPSQPSTGGGLTIPVTLIVYAIDYKLSNSASMPVRDDFLTLEGATADYFEQYMRDAYMDSFQSTLVEFQTFLVTSILTPGSPVQVQWESTAVFTSDSVVVPTPEFLNGVLGETLDDPQDYISALSLLPSSNPFSTTSDATFATPMDPPISSSTSTTRNSMIGIVGAAAGLSVILAAFVLYRSRLVRREKGSGISHNKHGKGDTTVAGDTVMGDTHASSGEDDGSSTDTSTRPGMFWKRSDKVEPSRSAVEDFDAYVNGEDELGSMSDVLSDALASLDTSDSDRYSLPDTEPLDSRIRRLKHDIDGMRSELGDAAKAVSSPVRQPKSVAEIEKLLTGESRDWIL